jgi:Flp pilus assembly protein TadB
VSGLARWNGSVSSGALAVVCLAVAACGALATIGFRHDVGHATTYHELASTVVAWHGHLVFWSWASWLAVALLILLLVLWCATWLRGAHRTRRVRRPLLLAASLLSAAAAAQSCLTWWSQPNRPTASSQMHVIAGSVTVDDGVREATLAMSPRFPVNGWLGLAVAIALSTVIIASIVTSYREDRRP